MAKCSPGLSPREKEILKAARSATRAGAAEFTADDLCAATDLAPGAVKQILGRLAGFGFLVRMPVEPPAYRLARPWEDAVFRVEILRGGDWQFIAAVRSKTAADNLADSLRCKGVDARVVDPLAERDVPAA